MRITIGITDCGKFENYHRWFAQEQGVEVVRLSHYQKNLDDIRKCEGVVLSGGEDLHPRWYNKPEFLDLCHEVDEPRDEFEWKVLDYTRGNNIPLLGICRGLQVVNVHFGGTLLPHIPVYGKFDHSRTSTSDRYHRVQVDPNSLLKEITLSNEGDVNSAHHQAADRIGDGLVANSISPDGIVEGLERQDHSSASFLLLVQWHPERMNDLESPFSKNIKQKFLQAVHQSKI